MRSAHFLSNSKGERRPRHIVFFDTETNIETLQDGAEFHTLKLGHALYCRLDGLSDLKEIEGIDFYDYNTINDWLVVLANRHDKLYLVCHNVAFDVAATHLFEQLARRGYKLKSLYSKATTSLISFSSNKRIIWLLDNSNFFTGKLETLGKLVGRDKGKVSFDNVSNAKLLEYCQNDVMIMVDAWRLWFKFLEKHDIGNWKMTTSSTAFEAFRHKFIPHSIAIHDNDEAILLEREAYHGGRVETKYLGYREGRAYYLDVNSMYPYVMSQFQYPYRLYSHYTEVQLSAIERWLNKYSVIARCKIKTEVNAYPAIVNKKLCYPVGEFITTLSTPELEHVLEHGEILEVYEAAYYAKYPLFREYVDYFYKQRLVYRSEGNKPFEQICKLMGNGLYGKFGQKEINQQLLCEAPIELVRTVYGFDIPTNTHYTDVTLGGMTIRTFEGLVAYNSFPAIASHVTAYARMYLYSLIEQVSLHHFYYCDTDSLIVDEQGYHELLQLVDENRLGGLKIEKESAWLAVAAPKVYNMGDRARIKGISKSAHLIAPNTWRQQRWPKLGSMLATYGTNDYTVFQQNKTLSFNSQTCVPSVSGWTSPLRLSVVEGQNRIVPQSED